ncbi:MAG TPA: ATP-binding cassette domain-containing protein [Acidimicrobiia bacterium]|nr:ATP-binding cassette domain-containing protein [Acidimicrobiia bacterium]
MTGPAWGGPEAAGLEVDGLTVRFGGKTAVDGLSLAAPLGRVTGLIGPNGAGKTTTFGAVSGLVPPSAGTVRLFGHDVSRRPAAARARLGLGRTFQRPELCPSLTVMDNVALGCEALAAGGNLWRQIVPRRRDTARLREQAARALAECGIAELAGTPVAVLSVGQRRLVELARVAAGGYRLLLLDEPSSGLDPAETARFGAIVRHLVEDAGVGVLLVEHDMSLVMEVCDFLYTLDFGRLIFAGPPAETRASAAVRAAYLGDDDAALSAPER